MNKKCETGITQNFDISAFKPFYFNQVNVYSYNIHKVTNQLTIRSFSCPKSLQDICKGRIICSAELGISMLMSVIDKEIVNNLK